MNSKTGYLLIVEDDADIRKLLETTLTFEGYRVITASNGKEAFKLIQADLPAIVITDIMMPKMDGFGLVHRLRLEPETKDTPVIFITATFVTLADQEFALNIGATRFIQKPVDMEKFLETIAELLEQGAPPAVDPLREFNFYDGYRKRLEAKLDQKNKHIARDELLLATQDADRESLKESLRHAINERDELKLLLEQIYRQLEKYVDSE